MLTNLIVCLSICLSVIAIEIIDGEFSQGTVLGSRVVNGFLNGFYNFALGNYFGSHFIMGGEKFESAKSDAYLFGENEDLNFLGSRPMPVRDFTVY